MHLGSARCRTGRKNSTGCNDLEKVRTFVNGVLGSFGELPGCRGNALLRLGGYLVSRYLREG